MKISRVLPLLTLMTFLSAFSVDAAVVCRPVDPKNCLAECIALIDEKNKCERDPGCTMEVAQKIKKTSCRESCPIICN